MLNSLRSGILFLAFLFTGVNLNAQQATAKVFGRVVSGAQLPLELVNIRVAGATTGSITNHQGMFELIVPANFRITLHISFVGFTEQQKELILTPGERRRIDIVLMESSTMIPGPVIEDRQVRSSTLSRLDPKLALTLPSIAGSIESLVKTMPGVSSSNELSSQYSVRGGNFDENLVYVNDIEIYRPFLIRSGQQEGLSFVNSDMVSSIQFSAGGFDARFGDKMSSVLDIQYKKPASFNGSVSGSFLGASGHIEGLALKKKLSFISGLRYKSNQYILRALDTKGEYKPSFTDFQTYLSWTPNARLELAFLGNYANNNYKVVPTDRETSFGTISEAYKFKVYFDGQEIDRFENFMGAVSLSYKPRPSLQLKWIGSAFRSLESETYDLLGQYWIGRLEADFSKSDYGEVVEAIGVGSYLNSARNYLDAKVFSFEHKGSLFREFNSWQWGVKYQHEKILDRIREWQLIDSAGFSLPHPPDFPGLGNSNVPFTINFFLKSSNELVSNRLSSYFQSVTALDGANDRMHLSAGIRLNYWDLNSQTLVSPRLTLSYKPKWEKDILLRLSAGFYYQPPFYRELRNPHGELNFSLKAQKSIHLVAGSDLNFIAWDRPFKFTGEMYYKYLDNLVPYEIDNVRIRYYATNNARGFAAGIDLKVTGEFVKGIDSWASLSVMKTMEDIKDDFYYTYLDYLGRVVTPGSDAVVVDSVKTFPGYIPRPTDQRVNLSIMFQDYLPRNPTYKMHLSLLFGSGLTFGTPGTPKYKHTLRIPPYRRVDIGFSKQIIGEQTRLRDNHPLRRFKTMWASLEVFNLLQISNTVSYIWVSDVNNRKYGVPNYLTPRQINLRLQATF